MRNKLDEEIAKPMTATQLTAAWVAFTGAAATVLLLAGLHMLSPEFDPRWRMVSEYANGHHGWVLSLMFATWAVSCWALALAIRSRVETRAGRIGLVLLVVAGAGEAGASVFDLNNPLHDLAGALGIPCLPLAVMLISVPLGRTQPWSTARRALLWTANLAWVSLALLLVTFIVMIASYVHAGGDVTTSSSKVPPLPSGVIALVGLTNRLLVLADCAWVAVVAGQAIRLGGPALMSGQVSVNGGSPVPLMNVDPSTGPRVH
ncbi:MAG: DUF998 domain-containing protein [Candidatus Dormibacteraeota bacterium]|uniref:DUF998 domain-containing protein n=1 Tax=Candidatus Dormiibacter inghamiae TaxID=3127013 RepID=A0A934NGH0_9BACT|nr:DUF998 domain-containing protein [Candidatus Dormibacteraeota bacterium]MBJ7605530.1 DUF998 domain-containing protein [Candidatus Dormibacteraeota bacterium]